MKKFEFTLVLRLPDADKPVEEYLDVLYEAGCSDAVAGIGRLGYIALDFDREAVSQEVAEEAARKDVLRAIPGVEIIGSEDVFANLDRTREDGTL